MVVKVVKPLEINLCVAACEGLGIGINGSLPWRLKEELKHFHHVTTKVLDKNKRNAAIMGRKTYFGIPEGRRPLKNRLNIVLSHQQGLELPPEVIVCSSLPEALKLLEDGYRDQIEKVWIVGGHSVYKEAMDLENCHRISFTDVKEKFDCDTFFPDIPETFKLVDNDAEISPDIQEENGIQYQFLTYEKTKE